MKDSKSSIDGITYVGVVIYVLLTTISISDTNFLLPTNKISLPIIEVEISLDWFGFISPILIFIAFAIHYELEPSLSRQKSYGNFQKIKSLTDWIFLLLSPLSLFVIFTRYSDYQSKIYFIWHLTFFLFCSFYCWIELSYKFKKWTKLVGLACATATLPLILIAFDVIFLPNKYSPTLWLAKNTTLLYRDGDSTVWFLPNISIPREEFLLEKTQYKNSEEFLSKIASSDISLFLNKASTLVLRDRNLKYLQLPNQFIPFLIAKNVDFTGANFASAYFPAAHISESRFEGADLSFSDLRGSQIFKTEISESLLPGSNFRGAFLGLTSISDTSMAGNTFEGARIQYSRFKNINFSDAKISGSRLIKVTFENIEFSDKQYVFEGSFSPEKNFDIKINEENAQKSLEDAFCQRQMNFLNNIEIHRVMQIKKFESKEVAEDFLKKIKETEKCKDVYEYYSKTEINIFDFFRK